MAQRKIIKLGSNPQKTVFVMLAAILLLEFGSLTKLQTIWGLAFALPTSSGNNPGQPTTPPNGPQPTQPTHTGGPQPAGSGGYAIQPTHPGEVSA